MVRAGRFLALLLMAFLVSTTTSAQQPQTGTAVVAGRVMDVVTGSPVAGAVVTIVQSLTASRPATAGAPAPPPPAPARRAVAVTNDDGRFVFRDLPAGSYAISTGFPGLAPGAYGRRRPGGLSRNLIVADGARANDVAIAMWKLGAISGTVRDDRGEPVVGIAIRALRKVINGGRVEFSFTDGGGEVTDDRGRYRMSGLFPGTYVVTFFNATQSAALTTVDAYQSAVAAGTAAGLMRSAIETGAINLNSAGLVFGDWQLSVSSARPHPVPAPGGGVLIQPTVFYPGARLPAEATQLTMPAGGELTGIDLTVPLVPGMRVSGVLMGPAGPAANHGMRLYPVSSSDAAFEVPVAYCTTDAAGRFAFLGVPAGAYVIRAYRVTPTIPISRPIPAAAGAAPVTTVEVATPPAAPPPSVFAELPVTVGASHVDGVSLSLQQGARLVGRVVFEGSAPPPPPARVQQMILNIRPLFGEAGPMSAIGDTRVDADGHFATSAYAPGRYRLTGWTIPGPEWRLASFRIGNTDGAGQAFTISDRDLADVVMTFTDKVTTVSGEVRAPESSASPEATVVLFPADVPGWIASGMSPLRTLSVPTSPAGAYQLQVLLPGDYLMVAIPPEVAPDVDADFVKRFGASAVRISFAAGETKTQALTLVRPR